MCIRADVDANSNRSKDPHKVLEVAADEREKKKKYRDACFEQRRQHFSPSVVSTDGILLAAKKKRRSY